MAQSATDSIVFSAGCSLPLTVDFPVGRLTSDGSLPWLADADAVLGLTATLSSVVPEPVADRSSAGG